MKRSKRASAAEQRKMEILKAALSVFSAKGFHQATNRDIAEEAGIASPGLIYHYFRDKRDLLMQIFERFNPLLQMAAAPGPFLQMPLREGLVLFAQRFLGMGRDPEMVEVLRLYMAEALRDPAGATALFEAGPGRGLGFLAGWLEPHIQQRRLRPLPARVLARQFVGPLLIALLTRVVFCSDEALNQTKAEQVADLFLKGAAL